MTDIVESLLPCPFCGAAARTDLLPHSGRPGWVQCSECECDQYMCDTIEEAVAKWNRRAPAQGALLPALIEIRNWCMVEGCSEQVDVADKAMIAAGVKDIPCFQCSGDGQWDEGPLSVSSSAQISPEYRTVICEECTGSGRLHFSLSSAQCGDPTPSAPDASAHVQRPHE
jgi:hypothetical protein